MVITPVFHIIVIPDESSEDSEDEEFALALEKARKQVKERFEREEFLKVLGM